jgi:4a-hydroxytetrahydrobiopterin dehydratase
LTDNLADKERVPGEGGTPALKGSEVARLLDQLGNGWRVVGEHDLKKEFWFTNFRQTLDFANKVGEIAEQQGHHLDMCLGCGRLELMVWTHKIDGLTESDFIFAAKVDAAPA